MMNVDQRPIPAEHWAMADPYSPTDWLLTPLAQHQTGVMTLLLTPRTRKASDIVDTEQFAQPGPSSLIGRELIYRQAMRLRVFGASRLVGRSDRAIELQCWPCAVRGRVADGGAIC